jgi:hypothetical protein
MVSLHEFFRVGPRSLHWLCLAVFSVIVSSWSTLSGRSTLVLLIDIPPVLMSMIGIGLFACDLLNPRARSSVKWGALIWLLVLLTVSMANLALLVRRYIGS